jgi:hypothetical protein
VPCYTTKSTKDTKKSEHEALNAVFEHGNIEVDQETNADACKLHIGEKLRLVYPNDPLHGLELSDELILHYEVDAIPTIKSKAFVFDWQWTLKLEAEPTKLELTR